MFACVITLGTFRMRALSTSIFAGLLSLAALPAFAAQCQPPGGFPAFLESFKQEAKAQGIGSRGLSALNGLTLDTATIAYDRKVRASFKGSFQQFAATRVTSARINRASGYLKSHAPLFQKIEAQFGVPGPVIVAIWAMETDFGAVTGNKPILPGLASLAYDCRRPDLFQRELLAALTIIDRGDMSAAELRGAGHGELGQTQFLPSSYVKFAVDFDGNGKKDLIRSQADVLASTANYLRGYGWSKGGGWQEGSGNFAALAGWNKSPNYQRAIALFATKVSGGS
jgi:lytic murein transglycosylase